MDNKSKNENHQVERDAALTTADKSIDKSVIIKGFNQHF